VNHPMHLNYYCNIAEYMHSKYIVRKFHVNSGSLRSMNSIIDREAAHVNSGSQFIQFFAS